MGASPPLSISKPLGRQFPGGLWLAGRPAGAPRSGRLGGTPHQCGGVYRPDGGDPARAAHQQGQQALLYAVYDAEYAPQALAPDTFSMYSTTYNAMVTFGVPQSGVFMVAALTPDYVTAFTTPGTPPYTVTIPGAAHGWRRPISFVQAYDAATPAQAIGAGSLAVHTTTFDVTLTFATPQSGIVVLAVGTPRYAQAFTNQTSVTIPGSTHGLGSPNLLHTVYAPSGSEPCRIQAGSLSVHPTTFDVLLAFAVPQSGVVVLAPVPSVTPVVFSVQPLAGRCPRPLLATSRSTDDRAMAQVLRRVEALTPDSSPLKRPIRRSCSSRGTCHQRSQPHEPCASPLCSVSCATRSGLGAGAGH